MPPSMSTSNIYQPPPSINRSTAAIMKLSQPSQSSIKKYKVEIHLNQPLDSQVQTSSTHVYKPGDLISGELLMTPPLCSKTANDIKFNEITIQLDCKVINNAGAGTKTLFSMTDNPSNIPSALVSTTSFPFSFKLPQTLLDNTCPNNIELHQSLPPSYGSPRLCSLVFSATENAGSTPSECPMYDVFKSLPFNRLCVVYHITATVAQKFSSSQDSFILFRRILDIPVQNQFQQIPTNLSQTSYDIANHYSCSELDENQNLKVLNSTILKSNKIAIGTLSSSANFPPSISLSQFQHQPIHINLKFNPSIGPTPALNLKYIAELTQYAIQTSSCSPSTANPQPIPETYKVTKTGNKRKVVEKVQSIECGVFDLDDWIPDYDDQDILVKNLSVQIPNLARTKMQPTFHTCILQNVYILVLKIYNNDQEEIVSKGGEKAGSSLFNKMGISKSASTSKAAVQGTEALKIEIPVTVLS